MRKLVFLFIILSVSITSAQSPGRQLLTGTSQDGIVNAYAEEAITIDATAGGKGFTAATISPTCTNCPINTLRATRADCVTEANSGAQFRVTLAGTTVTSSVGQLLTGGVTFSVVGYTNIAAFRAIRTASTSIAMYCVYSRPQ